MALVVVPFLHTNGHFFLQHWVGLLSGWHCVIWTCHFTGKNPEICHNQSFRYSNLDKKWKATRLSPLALFYRALKMNIKNIVVTCKSSMQTSPLTAWDSWKCSRQSSSQQQFSSRDRKHPYSCKCMQICVNLIRD